MCIDLFELLADFRFVFKVGIGKEIYITFNQNISFLNNLIKNYSYTLNILSG